MQKIIETLDSIFYVFLLNLQHQVGNWRYERIFWGMKRFLPKVIVIHQCKWELKNKSLKRWFRKIFLRKWVSARVNVTIVKLVSHLYLIIYGKLFMLGKFWKQNDSSMVFDTCENVSQRFRMMGLLLDQIKKLVSLKCKKRFL